MMGRFEGKSSKVIVVDPSGAVRQLLTEVVRKIGYASVQGVASLKEVMDILELEEVDWVITPLLADQPLNAMQLLAVITETSELRQTRISFILEESEEAILPAAYEMGLLCHFEKPFNKSTITTGFDQFMEAFARHNWDETKVAASYLRTYLVREKHFDAQIKLECGLSQLYPGQVEFVIEAARAHFALGDADKAKINLKQARILDETAAKRVDEVAQALFGIKDPRLEEVQNETTFFNAIGLEACLIVDPDEASRRIMGKTLRELGVKAVEEFEDGESLWKWLSLNPEPNLIIQEWRIPKLPGPVLIQRIRKRCPCVPIIVVSSLVAASDAPLLREMGVATLVQKPVDTHVLVRSITQVIAQERIPTDAEALELRIHQLLEGGRYDEALKANERYMSFAHVPEGRKKRIMAEFAYADKNYPKARDLAVEAIKSQTDSVGMLNFLGKCLMQLRDFRAALKCFEKADSLSPMNIQRLCQMVEASSELGDSHHAEDLLAKAKQLDQGSEAVGETEASLRIGLGQTKQAKAIMDKLPSLNNIISFMNNRAVLFARSGSFDEGIDLYRKTLDSIPDEKAATKAIVNYNLALAFARMDRLDEAVTKLDEVLLYGNSKVYDKSRSLKARIKKTQHGSLELRAGSEARATTGRGTFAAALAAAEAAGSADPNTELEERKKHEVIVATIAASPGDICCFRVFKNPLLVPENVQKLLSDIPQFKQRQVIERETASGIEKSIKGG